MYHAAIIILGKTVEIRDRYSKHRVLPTDESVSDRKGYYAMAVKEHVKNDSQEVKVKRRRLTSQIPAVIAAAVLAIVAIMCLCFNILSRNTVTDLMDKEIEYIADQNAQTARSYLESMNVYAEALGSDVQRYQTFGRDVSEPMIIDALKSVVKSGRVFSAYFAFEPNVFFPDTPKGLSYYAYQDGSSITMDINNDYSIYPDGDYYAPTKESRQTHITAPYIYELSSGESVWLITLSTPVLDDSGRFLGVANCDIQTESIGSLDYTTGGYSTAYSCILDNAATYIAHTCDDSIIGTQETAALLADALPAVLGGESVIKEISNPYFQNGRALAIYQPIALDGTDLHWVSSFVINQSEAYSAVTQITIALIVLGLIGIGVLTLLCFAIIRRSLKPIAPLMRLAKKIGRYDLSEDAEPYQFPNNEMGDLASVFLSMSDKLKAVISDESYLLGAMSAGDFTVQSRCAEQYAGELQKILNSINQITTTLGSTLSKIDTASDNVSINAEQVSAGAQTLAQGAAEQASSVEELAATITEISEQISGTSRNAEEASRKVDESGAMMDQCEGQMKEMVAAMSEISENSQQIGRIIKTIEDIAFQTNILALNAAVEAARAGEAGKGFAVVADEVRNLAGKSAAASQDTAALIEAAVQSVAKGAGIADATAVTMNSVAENAKITAEMVGKIAEAAQQQAVSIAQVTQGVDQISSVVQTTSATSEQSAASSEEMSAQAQVLKELVSQFKLTKHERVPAVESAASDHSAPACSVGKY